MFLSDPIESTYFHKVNVYRIGTSVTEWGETLQKREIVYENLKCAVSFTGMNDRNKAPFVYIDTVTAKLEYHSKLYFNPRYDILAGDEIEDISTGRTYLAGECAIYDSHKEVVMLRRWKDI